MIGSASSLNLSNLSSENSLSEFTPQLNITGNDSPKSVKALKNLKELKSNPKDDVSEFLSLLNNQQTLNGANVDFEKFVNLKSKPVNDFEFADRLKKVQTMDAGLSRIYEQDGEDKIQSKIANNAIKMSKSNKDVADLLNQFNQKENKIKNGMVKEGTEFNNFNFKNSSFSTQGDGNKVSSQDHINLMKLMKENGNVGNTIEKNLISNDVQLKGQSDQYAGLNNFSNLAKIPDLKRDDQSVNDITNTIANQINDVSKNNLISNIAKNDVQFDITHKDLGLLNISVKRVNKNIEIKIVTDQIDTKDMLMANKDFMQNQLNSRGIQVGSVQIESSGGFNGAMFGSVDDSSFKHHGNSKQDSSSQQHSSNQESSRNSHSSENGKDKRDELWQILKDQRELVHA